MSQSYIKITPERLTQAREKKETLMSYFGFIDKAHTRCRFITRQVYTREDGSYYVNLGTKRYDVTKTAHNIYHIV